MNAKKTEDSITEAAIKLASTRFLYSEGEKIMEEARIINLEEKITDEEMVEFEKLCKKEFAKQTGKKIGVVISKVAVAAAVVLVISISGVTQLQLRKNNEVVTNGAKTTEEHIVHHDSRIKYTPNYIPEGFVEEKVESKDDFIKIIYAKGDMKNILFSYKKKNASKANDSDNDENYEVVNINGIEAKVTRKPSENIVEMTWEKGKHIFCINAQGVDQKEVIKIAESVK